MSVDLTDLAKTSRMLNETIAARVRLEADLKSMGAPTDDNTTLKAFFEAYDRHLAALRDLRAATGEGNLDLSTQLVATQGERMKEMEDQAAAYGFSFCGRF
ncbi:MAG TPA: hypothetical protein VFH56_12095 [Acidimicrobiales bacterium]|nr:hypothetical protein [Acidimicrobiales bacterium]